MRIMYEVNNLIVVCMREEEREFIWVTTAAEILNYPEEYTARVSDAYKRMHHMWVKHYVRGEKRNCWKKMCLRINDKTLMNFMLRKDCKRVASDWQNPTPRLIIKFSSVIFVSHHKMIFHVFIFTRLAPNVKSISENFFSLLNKRENIVKMKLMMKIRAA